MKAVARRGASPFDKRQTGTRRTCPETDTAPLVLVVDDVEENRDRIADLLRQDGLRVTTAVDGDHALLKVSALVPDLVVMDFALPIVDGFEATRRIKGNERLRHIPVVAIATEDTDAGLARASEAGADAVLVRPCPPDALVTIARRLLRRRAV